MIRITTWQVTLLQELYKLQMVTKSGWRTWAIHGHRNNPEERKYSGKPGIRPGIELVKV
jgi:hypothetical protein